MVYSEYTKQRILFFYFHGVRPYSMQSLLLDEGIPCSREGIRKVLKKYVHTNSIARTPGSGRPTKLTTQIRRIVEEQMRADDETTAMQLYRLLRDQQFFIAKSTVLRCRTSLGWTFRGSAYCQLIRDANRSKRLLWAKENVELNFGDVIWTDKSVDSAGSSEDFAVER